ncbi:3-isopropylmalate dehydrogenase [Caproiciproducens sp. NJN-50]|uniref:3-isopropylmalate dehydrogenase n=1 Tax=Acutalibacteraceae TaxID=3082771 RepID=UPI000FFE2F05|nr:MULTISPECIES: 3-isopropylmalate dehydrogenase [Acutalibacteraceae]QAT50183.1 3-isopropylmalate dehydrogenase [Caproiciproducens sp. NJN-50]
MEKTIVLFRGDGIGPEIVDGAVTVLKRVEEKFGHRFRMEPALLGGASIDDCGKPLTEETIAVCKQADAVLLGAVGGPKWDPIPAEKRPERGLLGIRKALGLYANLRPAYLYKELSGACPLKEDRVAEGIDLMMVRELTGGIYFGKRETVTKENGKRSAVDRMEYSEEEIERIGEIAFKQAMMRRKKLVSVDKANVLDTSRLWRNVMHRLSGQYPEVEYRDQLVDSAAMQLVSDPGQFDVIVTENMFGDILSDEASMAAGSIGMLPSASLGDGTRGLYEPIHGSAPDIAGQDAANPLATILSAAMMLRISFKMDEEARAVEAAVQSALSSGCRTRDIAAQGQAVIGCRRMSQIVAEAV